MTELSISEIREDAWLSAVCGHPVYRIIAGSDEDLEERLARHVERQAAALYYAKIETDQIARVHRLCSAGLRVIDAQVTFRRGREDDALEPEPRGPHVRDAAPADEPEVARIAGSCFRYSRFHLDPLVPRSTADRIKREWITSYFRKRRGDRLLVAAQDGQPAGFAALSSASVDGATTRIIDLIGVETSRQRQGVGTALVRACLRVDGDRAQEVRVGTQLANAPSIRLYERMCFSLVRSQYVLHGHVRDGAIVSDPDRSTENLLPQIFSPER
jgi:GNAT superfamily N-acetyltransferase